MCIPALYVSQVSVVALRNILVLINGSLGVKPRGGSDRRVLVCAQTVEWSQQIVASVLLSCMASALGIAMADMSAKVWNGHFSYSVREVVQVVRPFTR